ncbi:MAG: competence/damage-inducible protein A [Candidatus Kapabacteria bacterium]|nr:competence/damage-inducible protein A [Candidatus Kapabacteria bacterium]
MKASILTIGTEICIGQIVNSNAATIGAKLTQLGISVIANSSIPDHLSQIVSEIRRLSDSSDLLIITGGLGPTQDDITKTALCQFFECEMIFDDSVYQTIDYLFKSKGREVTERNRAQAYIPAKAVAMTNLIGTAPGLLFENKGKMIVALPGVPYEMEYIYENSLKDKIKSVLEQSNSEIELHKTIRTYGIFESYLADLIGNSEDIPHLSGFAYLPSANGVRLRLTVQSPDFVTAEIKIKEAIKYLELRIGKYIQSYDERPMIEHISKLLNMSGKTVSVAESCTAGLLGGELTKLAGSSSYFLGGFMTYSNESKAKLLGIDSAIIDEHGAVSEEVAELMAKNVRSIFKSDIGISITGIAGPDGGTDSKPVGTVWFGLAYGERVLAFKQIFPGNRDAIRNRAVFYALNMLNNLLLEK